MNDGSNVWPNFFVVGAAKCGSTSVWKYLKRHPQVFIPEMKDPSFFISTPRAPGRDHCAGNLEAYQNVYREAKGYKAIGDTTVGYLFDRNAARGIHAVCPHARIVILLRDPVARAYSNYYMYERYGVERSSFFEAVQRDHSKAIEANNWSGLFPQLYVELGLYYEQVLRYIETFGREQVGIYLFEDMQKDTRGLMSEICGHIGVDPALLDSKELARVHNPGRVPRVRWLYNIARAVLSLKVRRRILSPSVSEWLGETPLFYKRYKQPRDQRATKYLQSIYEPDLCRLEALLGRKLPALRSTWV
jgi:hypothetical protein